MTDWIPRIDSLLGELDKQLRGAARVVRSVFREGPLELLAYRGFGNARDAHFYGRALANRNVGPSSEGDSAFKNLFNTYRRVDSDALPFAQLAVKFAGSSSLVKADDEGFFTGQVAVPGEATFDTEWNEYEVELISPTTAGMPTPKAKGEILVPPETARFGVISDLDDTVIQSRVSNFLQAARTVMLGNARTRLPFPGVAAFYHALHDGSTGKEKNPIFYVSSSPWNIYDVITEFMDLQKIPRGPVLLRDWDIGFGTLAATRHFHHKGVAIRTIMQLYPALPFILIGDSSQHDPEIYQTIVSEFPDRVRAIYIRDVTSSAARSAAIQRLAQVLIASRTTLVLSEDTLGAAKHAAENGWISAEALPSVREEKRADEGSTDEKVPTPGGGEQQ